jgi:hypothetical protein
MPELTQVLSAFWRSTAIANGKARLLEDVRNR